MNLDDGNALPVQVRPDLPALAAAVRSSKAHPADLRMFSSRAVWLKKVTNTFLQPRSLFWLLIKDADFDRLLQPSHEPPARPLLQRGLERLWFWPRITDAAIWVKGREGRRQNPFNYLEIDDQAWILLNEVDRHAPDHETAILDLGCNSGRHLDQLWRRGYRNLTGVDGMGEALRIMGENFPQMTADAHIHHDLFQRLLTRQQDGAFDLVYSHGATVELVHPSFDIVRHLCRVTRRHVILLIDENQHAYPRFWQHEFRRNGFHLARGIRPLGQDLESHGAVSLLVFQRIDLTS